MPSIGEIAQDFLTFPARLAVKPLQDFEMQKATGQMSLPTLPELPGMQGALPGLPELPGMQGVIPTLPELPGAQSLPSLPEIPGMQNVLPTIKLPEAMGAQSLALPPIPIPSGAQASLPTIPGLEFEVPLVEQNLQGSNVLLVGADIGQNQASDILLF